MYMPGRLRTASRPSRTDRCLAVYASVAPGADDVPDEAVRVGTCGRSPSEAHAGLIENSSVPGRVPLAMPRGRTAGNPRLTATNASTGSGDTSRRRHTVPVCYRYGPRVPVGCRHRVTTGNSRGHARPAGGFACGVHHSA